MKSYIPSSLHMPRHSNKFCTLKRRICFFNLGIIILCRVSEPEPPGAGVFGWSKSQSRWPGFGSTLNLCLIIHSFDVFSKVNIN